MPLPSKAPEAPTTIQEHAENLPPQTEARVLARAIFELRQARDPHAALSTLDHYLQLFPHGVLESESFRARLEALVQLNELKTALYLLDGQRTFADLPGVDLLLTRAELRASAGRCREALVDFTQVLESPGMRVAEGVNERALYGRAICLARLGDDARARSDLMAYRRRFPDGRFVSEAKRLLEGHALRNRP
jgi:hypothetical protein